jgi:hypothetical protein
MRVKGVQNRALCEGELYVGIYFIEALSFMLMVLK